MANEETEMNFVRCWNCRSLVPSSATRCRMCGSALSEAQAAAGGQEPPAEESGERRSRIRQKTLSISESAVQSIKASAAAGASGAAGTSAAGTGAAAGAGVQPPPLQRPPLGGHPGMQTPVQPPLHQPGSSQASASQAGPGRASLSREGPQQNLPPQAVQPPPAQQPGSPRRGQGGVSQVMPSGFRLGVRAEDLADPEEPVAPVSPSLSVTARALRELDEEDVVEESIEEAAPLDVEFQSRVSPNAAVAEDFGEDDLDDESDIELGELEGESDDLDASPEAPARKRKRRRRKKKKAGLQPGMPTSGAEMPAEQHLATPPAPGSYPGAYQRQPAVETGAPLSVAPASQSASQPARQLENQFMQNPAARPDAPHDQKRSEQNRPGNHGQPMRVQPPVDVNRKRVECPQGGLIGWFINYDKDKGGAATEIRCGRFFICGEKLKDTDLVLEHATLSTPHCLVKTSSQEGLKIQDLMSEHGTFIKRRGETEFRRQHETATVYHGDSIKFGEYEVMVCLIEFPFAD